MSGYVPKKVLNGRKSTTIEKNQTPMQAGLAPRIGKSGASIRLYWKRVDDDCSCGCFPEPIQITKRGIFPGNTVNIAGWVQNPPGTGNLQATDALGSSAAETNVFYVVVFNREITPSPSVVSNQTQPVPGDLRLRTPLDVNWDTFVLDVPTSTGGEVNSTALYAKNIPASDFKLLDFGNLTNPSPNNTEIGLSGSGWQIFLDGTTLGGGPGASGNIPAEELGVQGSGAPSPGTPLSFWRGSTINYRLGETPPGLEIPLSSPANPPPTAQQNNNGCMSYLITNPVHFGGYALVFNITRLIIASQTSGANYDSASYPTSLSSQRQYRSGLANITWYKNRNNIGVKYTSNEKTVLTNTDNCDFTVPVAPFKLNIYNDTLPILELIDSDDW